MTVAETPATWEFEAADPEVGFLSDTITHTCAGNLDDAEPAVVLAVNCWDIAGGKIVREQTVWECPVCKATTTSVDDWPMFLFESGPGGDE